MICQLYCTVNAIGTPYENTFRQTEEMSWNSHVWANVPKRGEHINSATMEDMELWRKDLKERGDRTVECKIITKELVTFEIVA